MGRERTIDLDRGRLYTSGRGRKADSASLSRGADKDTVHTTFHRQRRRADIVVGEILGGGCIEEPIPVGVIGSLHRLIVAGSNAANPCGFALQFEVNHLIGKGAAATLNIDHFHLEEHHVSPVGFGSFGIRDGGELQLIRFSGCLQFVAAAVGTYRFK